MRHRGHLAALLGSAAVLAATGLQAADYPILKGSQMELPPPAEMEPASRPTNWAGFYAGAHGGMSRSRFWTDKGALDLADLSLTGSTAITTYSPATFVATRPRSDSGPSFGVMAGYNMMFDQLMVGFELDWTRVDQKTDTSTYVARAAGGTGLVIRSNQGATIHDYASARIRLGWAMDNFLAFASAGVAVGRFDTNVSVTTDWMISNGATPPVFTSAVGFPITLGGPKKNVWGFGMSLGGGAEMALTDNLILRGEYLYTRFNDVNGVGVSLNTARLGAAVKF